MPRMCPNCRIKRCSYGYSGGVPVICCDCVKDKKMTNLYVPKCIYLGCGLSASYGSGIGGILTRCKSHAIENIHIPLTGRKCIKCGVKASYGADGSKTPIHCSTCAEKGEIRLIKSRLCACGKRAYYRLKYITGWPAILKRATHCGACMDKDTMEPTMHNKCEFAKCTKNRQFIKGISSDFCISHTYDKDILHCVQPNCMKLIISDSDKCMRHRDDKYSSVPKLNRNTLKTSLKYYLDQV